MAAYALGMAFAADDADADGIVSRLVEAARADVDQLLAARGRVSGLDVGDRATRQRATDLLTVAIRATQTR